MFFAKVREVVSRLPAEKRIALHNMLALPLITIGSTFLAGGRLIYEPTSRTKRIGFRSEQTND